MQKKLPKYLLMFIGCLLIILCTQVPVKASTVKKVLSVNPSSTKTVTIVLRNCCYVSVKETSGTELYCEYDNEKVQGDVTTSVSGEEAILDVYGKSRKTFQDVENGSFFKVYIPESLKTDQLRFKLQKSGCKIFSVPDVNVKVNAQSSAVQFVDAKNFEKKIKITGKASSVNVGIEEAHWKDINFVAKNCVIECAKGINSIRTGAQARIQIKVVDSSVGIVEVDRLEGYPVCTN